MARVTLEPLPPEDAIRFFRAKGYRIGFDWRDVWKEEHAKAFTVAKAMKLDILKDIRAALDDALANGATFEQFRERLTPLLQEKGWWGRQRVLDPVSGEERLSQLGSTRRLRIIYDTNLRTSNSAGRWARMQRTAASRPFLKYVAVQDQRTRPEHQAWHGTVLPIDHAFWDTHMPPNGWRCRCIVRQLSQRDLAREGLSVTDAPDTPMRPYTNRRTGEVARVPEGIDPGFDFNVGKAAQESPRDILTGKINAAHQDDARAVIPGLVDSEEFRDFAAGGVAGNYPVGAMDDALRAAIGARSRAVLLSRETAAKQLRNHADVTAADYARLQPMIDRGTVIQEADQSLLLAALDGRWWVAVVKGTRDGGEIYLQSMHRSEARQVRRLRRRGVVIREGIPEGE